MNPFRLNQVECERDPKLGRYQEFQDDRETVALDATSGDARRQSGRQIRMASLLSRIREGEYTTVGRLRL